MFFRTSWLLCVCLIILTLSGCESKRKMTEIYSTNMKKLHACYSMYMEHHSYIGPKNEEVFKKYLKNDRTAVFLLKRIEVTPEDVDGLFISERDGEPFEVRYGLKGEADHAVVFEKTGVDGERLIALQNIRAFGDEEYANWLSGKTKPERASETMELFENEVRDSEVVPQDANE